MNVSYRWLKDMVPGLELSPDAVAAHLTLRGAPVEGMHSPGAELGEVVIGKVITAGRHPNADRLSLCTVDAGKGVVSVVCGAPNVKVGSWYPFIPAGCTLPGGVVIKKSKIRGELSEGMLCSPDELALGKEHDGILEIFGDFTPGESFVKALGLDDVTLDVETTSNRGDLLSHLGIARELAAEGSGTARLPEIPGAPALEPAFAEAPDEVVAGGVRIRIEAPDLCFRYLGAVLRGVKIGASPAWLQERLRGAGSRPINNVVDATNHVMLEMGQPLHAFDLGKLGGSAIVVRRAHPDEKTFTTLDGEERALGADMLMICDAHRPVAVAGVMGGKASEVDNATTDVLLECALFDPKSIRATRKGLNLTTDASYRFERGVDPDGVRMALERAVAVILATAGGRLDGPVLDVCPRPFTAQLVELRLARVRHVLGVELDASAVRSYLEPLGLHVESEASGVLRVRVPGYRSWDITREVDLIEEVARSHGYDVFPAGLGAYRPGTVPDHPLFRLEDELRTAFVSRGFFEAQTPAFVPEGEGEVRVANPLNTREPFVRRVLLPSLLRRVEHNFSRGARDVRLFELGTSFRRAAEGGQPMEETHLVAALTGRREPPHWSVPEAPFTVWDLKGVLDEAVALAWRGTASIVPSAAAPSSYDPDACFSVVDGEGRVVGSGGRVAGGKVDAPVWADPVWALELTLPDPVVPAATPVHHPLPLFPAVERDLALLVGDAVTAGAVTALVRERGGELLEEVTLFDHYRGEGVPAGHRSVAFRLRFRGAERTLKDKEVDRAVQGIVGRLKEELGVEPRG
ncbi:MAG TPA: phenylalanine--tRNA ligase subunit beta [Longimicrobiales bacterium]|nr:phenylalanine--tRNA ligase subunit beta [Longimicrobiales bacterium]